MKKPCVKEEYEGKKYSELIGRDQSLAESERGLKASLGSRPQTLEENSLVPNLQSKSQRTELDGQQ